MAHPSTLPPILIAEDDPNDLTLLLEALLKAGAKQPTMTFGNGAELIQYLRDICLSAIDDAAVLPRLLLLDLHLPQIDGCGVIAWIRKQKALPGLRVVVVSGSGDSMDVDRATALGANRILVKPAPAAELSAEIVRLNHPALPSSTA